MELKYLSELFEEFKKSQQSNIQSYKTFCDGCKKHIEEIPTNYPAFISIGTSPVAGIGWGASELTKESQKKMSERWTSKYGPCLTKLKNNVEEGYIQELSTLVSEDRGRSLNLFVNRCIITLHNTDLFAIANIVDLKLLFELLNKIGINNVSYRSNNNQNLEWYINNLNLFSQLKKELNVNDTDDARIELSSFGWYLKEKLLRSMLLEKTLEHCHNIILTGAPGTGKTYMAKEIAKQMGAAIKFTQFHPSYDYTDFVEGLRPEKNQGEITFKRKDGIFKAFCKQAVDSLIKGDNEKFVIIIDEINRGEISKIFGELFFSIDPDYRVKREQIQNIISDEKYAQNYAIQTQYQNLIDDESDCFKFGFFVPENVYIIGTMNDIDRSVESLDFAMRRRFTFIEFIACEHLGMLDLIKDEATRVLATKKMDALNNALVNPKIGKLSSAYQIGGAYFVHVNYLNNSDDKDKWDDLWNYHLKGLLYEYYRGQPDADNIVSMLKKEYDNVKK